jgi:hypothetical protein
MSALKSRTAPAMQRATLGALRILTEGLEAMESGPRPLGWCTRQAVRMRRHRVQRWALNRWGLWLQGGAR